MQTATSYVKLISWKRVYKIKFTIFPDSFKCLKYGKYLFHFIKNLYILDLKGEHF